MRKTISVILALLMLLSVNPVMTAMAAITDFSFSELEDGTYEVTGYDGTENTVSIPYSYNGKAVTSIGIAAFFQNSYPFTTVNFPSSIKKIDIAAFSSNDNLRWISLNEGLERIEDSAFETCVLLSSVHIPSTVNYIGSGAFAYDEGITALTVEDGNTSFSSDGRVLYNADKTRVILYPSGYTAQSYVGTEQSRRLERENPQAEELSQCRTALLSASYADRCGKASDRA